MAYKGRRDPELGMLIPRSACFIYNSKAQGQMIEVMVPPEDASGYDQTVTRWGTIMVEPKQVRALNDEMNIVFINDGAQVTNSVKDDKRNVLSSETLFPTQIIGRWLKWMRYVRFYNPNLKPEILLKLNCDSAALYVDYAASHMRIEAYANRIPFIL